MRRVNVCKKMALKMQFPIFCIIISDFNPPM